MCDYEQPFIGDSKRLCIMCCGEIASCQRHYQVPPLCSAPPTLHSRTCASRE